MITGSPSRIPCSTKQHGIPNACNRCHKQKMSFGSKSRRGSVRGRRCSDPAVSEPRSLRERERETKTQRQTGCVRRHPSNRNADLDRQHDGVAGAVVDATRGHSQPDERSGTHECPGPAPWRRERSIRPCRTMRQARVKHSRRRKKIQFVP